MLNYFIIEKEQTSIDCIKNVMEDFKGYNCIGVSANYVSALKTILKEAPHLVFFNIDHIFENPFQFVHEITFYSENPPVLIAISSSKEKAYEVIKHGFFDLLINPMSDLEILKSISIFQKKNPFKIKNSICIKSYKDYQYLDPDEILFLKADNNTTDFYINDGSILCAYKTLKTFETLLPANFLRIH